MLVKNRKPQMNADIQVAYPRSSAVILIVPTCNVTISNIYSRKSDQREDFVLVYNLYDYVLRKSDIRGLYSIIRLI